MSTSHLPEHAQLPPPEVIEVKESIYAYVQADGSWGLNNTGFIVGRDAVTAIDTCFTEVRTRALLQAIGEVSELPLKTLINTHHHGDHTHGNYLLPAATIIGHERCRQAILASGLPAPSTPISQLFPSVGWGEIELAPPFVTFEDRLNIYVGDLKLEVIFVGPAHTTNDVIVWIPEHRLLFSGDLIFHGGTPFVVMGSVAGSLTALETLRGLGAETVVPGHGPVCGPEVLDDMVAYLRFVQEVARRGYDEGLSALDAGQQTDLGRFDVWHDKERLVGNLHRAYSEIRGEPLGIELEMGPIIGDMITYNGGKPLRCLA